MEQLLGEAVREILLLLVTAQIHKRQHRDGVRRRGKGGGGGAHEGCCTRWRPAGCRSLGRQQAPNSLNESRGWLACGEACPLRPRKRLWNLRGSFGSRVQANWQNEYTAASHHVAALVRKIPLKTEIAFVPRGRVRRNQRNKERALADLAPDLLVPRIPASQLALIEKDLDPCGPQCMADPCRRLGILRGVAQEHGPRRCACRLWRLFPHPRPLDLVQVAGECPAGPVSGNAATRTSAIRGLNGCTWTPPALPGFSSRDAADRFRLQPYIRIWTPAPDQHIEEQGWGTRLHPYIRLHCDAI